MPYLNTTDGTALFFRDWGSGDPVVFVHGWGLNSDMWEYQLPALVDRGLRCSPTTAAGAGARISPATATTSTRSRTTSTPSWSIWTSAT